MRASKQQPASESLEQRQLPRGQKEYFLPRVCELPRVRRSLGAKVAARERGALSRPGSLRLQETLRQVTVVRDCAYCQRGWQGDAEYCRLEKGCVLLCRLPRET